MAEPNCHSCCSVEQLNKTAEDVCLQLDHCTYMPRKIQAVQRRVLLHAPQKTPGQLGQASPHQMMRRRAGWGDTWPSQTKWQVKHSSWCQCYEWEVDRSYTTAVLIMLWKSIYIPIPLAERMKNISSYLITDSLLAHPVPF